MDLDDVVPVADHVTRQSRVIDAPPSVVWDELHRLQLRGLPVTLLLGAVRALPVLLSGRGHRRAGLDRTFLDVVPIPVLSSDPPSAVVFGGALQAWRLFGGRNPPALDAAGVREWSEPGWVKVGMEFRLAPNLGGTRLSCETRVAATDAGTRGASPATGSSSGRAARRSDGSCSPPSPCGPKRAPAARRLPATSR